MRREKFERRKAEARTSALERIKYLFGQAEKVFKKDRALANRYVSLARKVAMKQRARIPSALKRRFCKHCSIFWVPGVNVRVRAHNGKMVYYCLECKHFTRIGYETKTA